MIMIYIIGMALLKNEAANAALLLLEVVAGC